MTADMSLVAISVVDRLLEKAERGFRSLEVER